MNDEAVYRTAPATPGLLIIGLKVNQDFMTPHMIQYLIQDRFSTESAPIPIQFNSNSCVVRVSVPLYKIVDYAIALRVSVCYHEILTCMHKYVFFMFCYSHLKKVKRHINILQKGSLGESKFNGLGLTISIFAKKW